MRTFYKKLQTIALLFFVSLSAKAQISGYVFRDFNSNGVREMNTIINEVGISNVTVKAFDQTGALVSTQTSTANGSYSFTGLALPLRIEFSDYLSEYYPAAAGTENKSSIQFHTVATAQANFGLNNPLDYTIDNPPIVTSIMLSGDRRLPKTTNLYGNQVGVQDEASLVQFQYNNAKDYNTVSGLPHNNSAPAETPNNIDMAYAEKVGSIWGVAYQKQSKKLFTSAFMRRGAMFGPLGTGGIYVFNNANSTSFTPTANRNFIDVNTIGINTGTDPHPQPATPTAQTGMDLIGCDAGAFDYAGKVGIGDIEISEDGQDLFLSNLYDRIIYKIHVGVPATTPTSADVTAYSNAPWLISSPCTNGTARPFGLKVYRGKLYVGVVCTGENNGSVNDLTALVYQMDLATQTWNSTPVVNQSLNYTKGKAAAGTNIGSTDFGKSWNPWFAYMTDNGTNNGNYSKPTPILSNIDFDIDGSMILGLMDRTGHQILLGNLIALQNGSCVSDPARGYGPYMSVNSGGDILRAAKTGTNTWQMESNGVSGSITALGTNNGQGIGGGEFYSGDYLAGGVNNHEETFVGGLAVIPGRQLLATSFDPFGYVSGGVNFFSNITGGATIRYEVFKPSGTPWGGKGNGLGDIEALMPEAPIEIGNRVWNDANSNGIQDAGEVGINNVTVELYQNNILVGTTSTDAEGQYLFKSSNVNLNGANGILPSTIYDIRIATGQTVLSMLQLTSTNADLTTNGDLRDNDASGTITAVIALTTGVLGDNNHTYDFGFKPLPPLPASLGNYVWNDLNHDGLQNNNEVGVAGISVTLFNNLNQIVASTVTDAFGAYLFTNLQAGNYSVGFSLPANYIFTIQNADVLGINGVVNSDVNAITGLTSSITLTAGDNNMNVDAGIYLPIPIITKVGDKVWLDLDGDGLQTAVEPGVSGVTVTLYQNGNPVASTITDANGMYQFIDVVPGSNYSVGFTSPIGTVFTTPSGVLSTTNNSDVNAIGLSSTFTVNAGDNITYIDAGLVLQTPTHASIGDKVWNDANNNGIQDAGETGVSGITVTLYQQDGITIVSTTTTDALGNYSFNNLTAGSYIVGFTLPSGFSFSQPLQGSDIALNSDANVIDGKTAIIVLNAGQNNPTIDAGIYNASNTNSIGNKVWFDENKDGLQSPGEYGVPGVLVTLYDVTNTPIYITLTNANGNYLFDALSNGTYYVKFSNLPSAYQLANQNADNAGLLGDTNSDANILGVTSTVNLIGNTHIVELDGGIFIGNSNRNSTSSLGNQVWYDVNGNGVQDANESGVAGVVVTLSMDINSDGDFLDAGELNYATTITNALGQYMFTNLTEGDYQVSFSNLPLGYTLSPQNIGSDHLDSDGGTIVSGTSTTTIYSLGLGQENLTIDLGIVPPAGTASLGNFVWNDLNADGLQTIGEPGIPGVSVTLYNSTGDVMNTTTTSIDGSYSFVGLLPGVFNVGFSNLPTGYIFTNQNADLTGINGVSNSDANATTGLTNTVTLNAGDNNVNIDAGIISTTTASVGNIVWEDLNKDGIQNTNEPGIAGVLVNLYDNIGNLITSTVTDANGGYLFSNLNPSNYVIGFSNIPSGMLATVQNIGGSSADNNSNASTTPINSEYATASFTISAGEYNPTIDAGFYTPSISGLGNYVWFDANQDGLQTVTEMGISGVLVTLYEADGTTVLASAITDGNGAYSFPNLTASTYIVGFSNTASGFVPTYFDQNTTGINGTLNSDMNILTQKTAAITLLEGEYNPNIDAGFFVGTPLPVTLTLFTAANQTCSVDLKWQTKNEINLSHYNVMRKSENEKEYTPIAKVIAAGNSTSEKHYSFTDINTHTGNYTYMLNMVDNDGKTMNSIEASAKVMCEALNEILIYPNPTTDKLIINFNKTTTSDLVEVKLIDVTGKIVLSKKVNPSTVPTTILEVKNVTPGTYILQITNTANGNYSRKINIEK